MIYQLSQDYYVRGLQENDLDGDYPTWFEDQEINNYNSHGKFPKNKYWFQSYYDSLNNEEHLVWAICHTSDGHIGNISLQSISFINRNAELAILIGNKKHWGQSVGIRAAEALIKHGFLKLNLERIYCGTADTNLGMKNLALKLGMTEEGRRRNHLFLEGNWVDAIEYGILRTEFIKRNS